MSSQRCRVDRLGGSILRFGWEGGSGAGAGQVAGLRQPVSALVRSATGGGSAAFSVAGVRFGPVGHGRRGLLRSAQPVSALVRSVTGGGVCCGQRSRCPLWSGRSRAAGLLRSAQPVSVPVRSATGGGSAAVVRQGSPSAGCGGSLLCRWRCWSGRPRAAGSAAFSAAGVRSGPVGHGRRVCVSRCPLWSGRPRAAGLRQPVSALVRSATGGGSAAFSAAGVRSGPVGHGRRVCCVQRSRCPLWSGRPRPPGLLRSAQPVSALVRSATGGGFAAFSAAGVRFGPVGHGRQVCCGQRSRCSVLVQCARESRCAGGVAGPVGHGRRGLLRSAQPVSAPVRSATGGGSAAVSAAGVRSGPVGHGRRVCCGQRSRCPLRSGRPRAAGLLRSAQPVSAPVRSVTGGGSAAFSAAGVRSGPVGHGRRVCCV